VVHYTCERHKATGPCLVCQNEQNFITEQIFRDYSPLPEYRDFNVGAYGRPNEPNPYSKCPTCGGDTGACKCVNAGLPPNRMGPPDPPPGSSGTTPGNTDFSRDRPPQNWFDNYDRERQEAQRRKDNAAALTPEQTKNIVMHAYVGGIFSRGCKICGMGRISNCHL
jgi:hypothetical protein